MKYIKLFFCFFCVQLLITACDKPETVLYQDNTTAMKPINQHGQPRQIAKHLPAGKIRVKHLLLLMAILLHIGIQTTL